MSAESRISNSQASFVFEFQEPEEERSRIWEMAFKTSAAISGLVFLISGAALAVYFCPNLIAYSQASFYTAAGGLPVSIVVLSVSIAGVILANRRREIEEFVFSEENRDASNDLPYKTEREFLDATYSEDSKQLDQLSRWLKKENRDARNFFEHLKNEKSKQQSHQIIFLPNWHGNGDFSHALFYMTKKSQWQVYTEILSILRDLPDNEKLYICGEDIFYHPRDPYTLLLDTTVYDKQKWRKRYHDLSLQYGNSLIDKRHKPNIDSIIKAKRLISEHVGRYGAPPLLKFQGFPVEFIPTMPITPLESAMIDLLDEHNMFLHCINGKLYKEFISYARELRAIKSILGSPKHVMLALSSCSCI